LGFFNEGKSPTLLGQNMDLPSYYQSLETLLNVKEEDSFKESFIITFAGMIGLCGLNNAPLGLCGNTLLDLNGSLDGYPVAFLVRSILEQDSLENAVNYIKDVKQASGENYTIGDEKRVVSLECSSNKVCEFTPYKGANRTYHTNHPLVNDDLRVPPNKQTWLNTTHARFEYLESRLRDPSTPINLETMKYILSSHEGPVCAHQSYQPGNSCTFSSLIYILSKKPELHLTRGPPCSNKYEIFRFE
jgi:predicted choloylglycine hydrolase